MSSLTQADIERIRRDFPILEKTQNGHPLIYLDSAATVQKPRQVIEAMSHFYAREYGTVHRAIYGLSIAATERYCGVREKVRRFLNAQSADEIVFTKGTTEGINLVADCFGKAFLRHGDEVLICETEHHANIVPWQKACAEHGALLKIIPVNDKAEIDLKAYGELLSSKTKLVAVAHIANATGSLHPIETIIRMAHSEHAKVLIDGAQSAARLPIDVQKLDADFFLFSGHKVYGPTGVGILYGKRELLEAMPPYQCGGDMIEQVTLAATTYREPPLKFEAGTPMIAEVIGLGEALDYIEKIGREKISAWEDQLLAYATQKLLEIPELRIIGTAKDKGPIISFMIEGAHPLDIGTLLDLKGICVRTGHMCAQPTMHRFHVKAATRISFAIYNTISEIDQFILTLKEVLCSLRPSA
ncbi:MAG: SufS family cysteine desulfurase [Chlamydiales bacterium]|nr:SufS family cysteine desulfurase [Chlamydiales bacterium]